LVSSSNPEGSNWKLFEAAAAPGSWLMLLKRAGHTTFMKPPTGVEAWLLDRVFGGGEPFQLQDWLVVWLCSWCVSHASVLTQILRVSSLRVESKIVLMCQQLGASK
jgi:hypothetical protein